MQDSTLICHMCRAARGFRSLLQEVCAAVWLEVCKFLPSHTPACKELGCILSILACVEVLLEASSLMGMGCGVPQEIAHEEREKYKEGKYILERSKLTDMEEGYLRRACPAAIEDSDSDDCCRP